MVKETKTGRWLIRAAGVMTLVIVGTPAVLMLTVGLEVMGTTVHLSPRRCRRLCTAGLESDANRDAVEGSGLSRPLTRGGV